jgi:hypothetical protein
MKFQKIFSALTVIFLFFNVGCASAQHYVINKKIIGYSHAVTNDAAADLGELHIQNNGRAETIVLAIHGQRVAHELKKNKLHFAHPETGEKYEAYLIRVQTTSKGVGVYEVNFEGREAFTVSRPPFNHPVWDGVYRTHTRWVLLVEPARTL